MIFVKENYIKSRKIVPVPGKNIIILLEHVLEYIIMTVKFEPLKLSIIACMT